MQRVQYRRVPTLCLAYPLKTKAKRRMPTRPPRHLLYQTRDAIQTHDHVARQRQHPRSMHRAVHHAILFQIGPTYDRQRRAAKMLRRQSALCQKPAIHIPNEAIALVRQTAQVDRSETLRPPTSERRVVPHLLPLLQVAFHSHLNYQSKREVGSDTSSRSRYPQKKRPSSGAKPIEVMDATEVVLRHR